MLASPLVLVLVAPISGYLSDKFGSKILTLIGLTVVSISLMMMSLFYYENTAIWIIVLLIGIMSLGSGIFQSPNTSLIMSTVSKDKLGMVGSINALFRNAGMVFGISFASILLWSFVSYKAGYKVLTYIPENPDAFVL